MIYNLGIFLYGLFLQIAALFHPKAKRWMEGRKGYWNHLPAVEGKKVVWFHCASLGEYDQGKPIMEAWKAKFPTDFILVSFFSPSGYEQIKDKSVGDYTCYIPLDTPRNARKFAHHFRPSVTFFVKYEIWINHLKEANKIGSKLYSISASFRENHRFFKWYGGNFRKALALFDHIFVQNEKSKELLATIGINQTTVAGDTRFDRVVQRAQENKTNKILAPWVGNESVFAVGSSWPADEAILIPNINNSIIQEKVILAPHEVDQKHVEEITQQLKVSFQLYTNLRKGEALASSTRVVILDCIGVLADAYRYGKIAYVGGGFGTGLHNILEPAAFGLPVIFGNQHGKFPEAQDFINNGIGIDVEDTQGFLTAYAHFKEQNDITEKVQEFVQNNSGATAIIMQQVAEC